MKASRVFSALHLILSGVFFALGALFFALNVARCWEMWQAVGFICVYALPFPLLASLPALTFSLKGRSRRLLIVNAVALCVTIGVAVFSYLVSCNYG